MTTEDINNQLYRPLLNGNKFNHLFPDSTCEVRLLAKGNTKIALREMRKWAKKYQSHTVKIAKELFTGDIVSTVNKIQHFLFNHIQYSIDGENQNLKSPGCTWQTRAIGTDCKSYSIFASSILLNLGISHHLRRVKINEPNAFTHVYVAIPLNQKQPKLSVKSQFNKDYIIIDGTIQSNSYEQPFLQKDDLYMKAEPNLPIYGLASPMALGCGCENENQLNPLAMNGFVDDVSGIFSGGGFSFSCFGGTYDKKDYNVTQKAVTQGFDQQYAQLNSAMLSKNISQIEATVNLILLSADTFFDQTTATSRHDWSSRCSKDTTKKLVAVAQYFKDIAYKALFPFIQKYFNFNTGFLVVKNNTYPFVVRTSDGLKKNEFVRNVQITKISELSLKEDDVQIPAFEFTPYAIDNIQSSAFNLETFINSLSEIAFDVVGNNNNGNNNGNTDNGSVLPYPGGDNDNSSNSKILTATAVIGTGLLAYAFRKKIFGK